jgi:hypothetical protein
MVLHKSGYKYLYRYICVLPHYGQDDVSGNQLTDESIVETFLRP